MKWLLKGLLLVVFFTYLSPVIDRFTIDLLGTWYVYVMIGVVIKVMVIMLGLWLINFSIQSK